MTPRQLGAILPHIPQATLYRHIKTLLQGGILEVVFEQEINGAVERTYTLAKGAGRLTEAELQALTPEDHFRYFSVFAVKLMDDFATYLRAANPDRMGRDGMAYQTSVIYLSDAERTAFEGEVSALFERIMSQPPAPDRKAYRLSSIVIPDGKDAP